MNIVSTILWFIVFMEILYAIYFSFLWRALSEKIKQNKLEPIFFDIRIGVLLIPLLLLVIPILLHLKEKYPEFIEFIASYIYDRWWIIFLGVLLDYTLWLAVRQKNQQIAQEQLRQKIEYITRRLKESFYDIDEVLDKSKTAATNPDFYRPMGPMWVDFENGYVYERPEVAHLINRLKNGEGPLGLGGLPASGKTVIIRNIAFRLRQEGHPVFYFSLKPGEYNPRDRDISVLPLEELNIINGYLLIDDAHYDTEFINKHTEIFNSERAKRVLIASRIREEVEIDRAETTREQRIYPRAGVRLDEFLKNREKTILVRAEETVPQIIEKFTSLMRRQSGKENFEILRKVRDKIEKICKGDLWTLTFYLRALSRQTQFPITDLPDINTSVMGFITNEIPDENQQKVLLCASAFFAFEETPVLKDFLTGALRINEEHIKEITQHREIVGYKDSKGTHWIAMPHSARARIILKALEHCTGWLRDFKTRICQDMPEPLNASENWISALYYRYLCFNKGEGFRILFSAEAKYIEPILQVNGIKDLLNSAFNETPYIGRFAFSIHFLIPPERIAYLIAPETYQEKIRGWKDPGDIGRLINSLRLVVGYNGLEEILVKIEPGIFEEKIRGCEDLMAIGWLIDSLHEVGYEGLSRINAGVFEEKIRGWENPGDIGRLIDRLHEVGYKGLEKILVKIEPGIFEEKIRGCEDPGAIGGLIDSLHEVGYKGLEKILVKIEPGVFEEKIKGWEEPWAIGGLIECLHEVGYKRLEELLVKIEPGVFEEKIKGWEDPVDIDILIRRLHKGGYEGLSRINAGVFEEKIRGCEDPGIIGGLIECLHEVGYKRLEELLVKIEPGVFEEKIRGWEDPVDIGRLILILKRVGYGNLSSVIEKFDAGFFINILQESYSGDLKVLLLYSLWEAGYRQLPRVCESIDIHQFSPEDFVELIRQEITDKDNLLKFLKELNYSRIAEVERLLESTDSG